MAVPVADGSVDPPHSTILFDGQVIVGAVVSLTVKVVVQVPVCPAVLVAVTVIVCGPKPTSVPAAGL